MLAGPGTDGTDFTEHIKTLNNSNELGTEREN